MTSFGPLEDNEPMARAARQFMEKHFPQCQIAGLGYAEVGRGAGEIDVWIEQGSISRIVLYHATKEDIRKVPRPRGVEWSNGNEHLQLKELYLSNDMQFVPHDAVVENAVYALYSLKDALSELE